MGLGLPGAWAFSWRTTTPRDSRTPEVLELLPHFPAAQPIPTTEEGHHCGQAGIEGRSSGTSGRVVAIMPWL